MRDLRSNRVFVLAALLTIVQPILLVATHALSRPSGRGFWLMALLLVGLARRSRTAWVLMVLVNLVPLVAVVGVMAGSGGGVLWANIAVMVLTGVALEVVLLSRPMRAWLDQRGGSAVVA